MVALVFWSQRRVRRAIFDVAAGLGWTELKQPRLMVTKTAAGFWNGRRVAFHYWPPGKGRPAFLVCEIELPLAGRFELRGRPEKDSFFNRPLSLFQPPVIELFSPEDARRFRAWGNDRVLVDRLLSLPDVRLCLDTNLRPGDGIFTLKNGLLRIRRRLPVRTWMAPAGLSESAREAAREEWTLIAAASSLG